jgi:glyoxylase-like metal-dependent hydrolase (beta-lactamase superfamily II)
MKTVADGILMLENSGFSNAYLVEDSGGFVMVDAGVPGRGGAILAELKGRGIKPSAIKGIFLTHCHPDHIGNLSEIARSAGCASFIHRHDAEIARGMAPMYKYRGLSGRAISFILDSMHRFAPHPEVEDLDGGSLLEILKGWKVIHTPGHTPGSACLHHEDRGIIFVGDCLNNRAGRLKGPVDFFAHEPERAWESVKAVAELKPKTMLFGHGPAMSNGATGAISELLAGRT